MKKLLNNKKGISLYDDWVEIVFFIVLVLGFFTSIAAGSAVIEYFTILLVGMMAGRMIYHRKKKLKFPFVLILLGFAFGYILGVFYANKLIVLIVFLIGIVLSYRLHVRGHIR